MHAALEMEYPVKKEQTMLIAAFDPGKVTSFARFDTTTPHRIEIGEVMQVGSGRLLRPCAMHVQDIMQDVDAAIVEEVGTRPAEGVSSAFTFGLAVGAILGAIGARSIPLVLVPPQHWKRASRIATSDRTEAKDAARAYVRELWPEHEKMLRVKKNHGMAEAALMTRWYFLAGPGKDVPMAAE